MGVGDDSQAQKCEIFLYASQSQHFPRLKAQTKRTTPGRAIGRKIAKIFCAEPVRKEKAEAQVPGLAFEGEKFGLERGQAGGGERGGADEKAVELRVVEADREVERDEGEAQVAAGQGQLLTA